MTDISASQIEAAAKAFDDENVRLGAPRCGNYYFEHRLKPAINKALRAALSTPAAKREEGETVENLTVAAMDVLHHDRTEGSPVDEYERSALRKKFSSILSRLSAAKPGDEAVRLVLIAGVLRNALLTSHCPHPVVDAGDDRTVRKCIELGACGCDNKEALSASPKAAPESKRTA